MFDHYKVIKQYDTVTLPCIPSSPDVEVTLVKEIENQQPETIEIGFNSEGKFYTFSQFSGFRTDDTDKIQLLTYRCDFKRGNITLSYPVHVDVERETYSISKPKIEKISPRTRNIVGETITLKCSVKTHVRTHFLWTFAQDIDNDKPIQLSENSKTDSQNPDYTYAILTIRNTSLEDAGTYTCQVSDNQGHKNENSISIRIFGKPSIDLKLDAEFQKVKEKITVECIMTSYPAPSVNLMYKPCFDDSCDYTALENVEYERTKNIFSASVTTSFVSSGVIKCIATQSIIGDSDSETFEKEIGLFISDVENGFAIESQDKVDSIEDHHLFVITIENSIEMKCAAYIRNFTQKIKWRRDSKEIISDEKYTIITDLTEFSILSILNISDINSKDTGFYRCELYKVSGDTEELTKTQSVAVAMSAHIAPTLVETNLNSTIVITDGSQLELTCIFKGAPKPNITWYKNNGTITSSSTRHIDADGRKITFTSTAKEDEGNYTCEGKNVWGTKRKETKFVYKPDSGFKLYGIIIGVLTLLVIIAFFTTLINHFNKKKLEKLLEEAGLTNFEEGQLDNLNPKLGIEHQVEFLPYDRNFEFPFKNLKLGKILGSGAFGVVVLGEARGILPHEKVTAVAVKMVDRNAHQLHIKALVAELKILIHLGRHINVVNLLGACTKNIAKRELLVIEEYCKYGNLQILLYRHRSDFINQFNPSTGRIDFGFEEEISTSNDSAPLSSSKCVSPNCNTEESTCSTALQKTIDEEEEKTSADRCEENKRFKSISTADLLSWSFQVARGMEYLVSRRVMHGDLAARNILLADDDVVKICDFGLAKRTYQIENYKKTSDGPLPVKWMAIESIRDRVFSSQSDVWSFGIVLWEFFSLAKVPYPGMEADEKLFAKLEAGYRMEAPKYSNLTLYQIMLDCWSASPLNRPSFSELSERLGHMLEDNVRTHYIKLNDPYLMMNAKCIDGEKNDYLTMVTPPSFQLLSSPQNDGTFPSKRYVTMSRPSSLQMKAIEVCYTNIKSEKSPSLKESSNIAD